MHREASPHLDAYRRLLTSKEIAKVFKNLLDGYVLSSTAEDGRSDHGTLSVRQVKVQGPLHEDGNAGGFWIWIEVALSLSRGQQVAHCSLRFRVPGMSSSGTFLIGGWNYTPVVQLVPAPGLAVRSHDTPSGLARIARADIIPERGRGLRISIRRELVRTEETAEEPLPVRISYFGYAAGEGEEATPTGKGDRQKETAAGSQEDKSTRRARRRRQAITVGGDAELQKAWFKAAFRDPPGPPSLGQGGRKQFNDLIESIRSTRTHKPGSEELVTVDDLNAVLACMRELAGPANVDEAGSSAGVHHPADLGNLKALTIADHVRSGLRRAIEDALACVVEEFREREILRGHREDVDDGAPDEALWERGFRRDEELLAVFERFVQASVEFFPRTEQGLVRVPNTPNWVRSVFADRRLVQLLDETNPIASLAHRRQVTRLGPGGINPDYALPADRDLDDTHKGRLCPFETPESEHIGLVLQLARGTTIEDGTLKAASTENGGDVVSLGWSASLVPFLPHNDSARVLMAAKSMKQALPLREPEIPLVRTGAEREIVEITGAPQDRVLRPTAAGTLVGEASSRDNPGGARGLDAAWQPAVLDGELALGSNLRVAYMPFNGLNFEDGIVLSRSGAAKLTSRHGVRIVVKLRSRDDGDGVDEVLHWGGLQSDGGRGAGNQGHIPRSDRWGVVKKGEMVAENTALVRYCVLGETLAREARRAR